MTHEAGQGKEHEKVKKKSVENQFMIIMAVLVIFLISVVVVNNLFKPKSYFEVDRFKVYPFALEGTQRVYFSMPFTFVIGSTKYKGDMVLKTDPRMFENISIDMNSAFFTSRAEIKILIEPESQQRMVESLLEVKRLTDILNIPLGLAITYDVNNTNITSETPVMSCDESSQYLRLIYLNPEANETRIYEDKCIKIEALNFAELETATDAFLWRWMKTIGKPEK